MSSDWGEASQWGTAAGAKVTTVDFQNDEWYYNDDNQAIVLPTVPYRCVQIATYTDELGMKHTAYLLFLPEVPVASSSQLCTIR